MPRTILIRIVVDNRDAINNVKAQTEVLKQMHKEIAFGADQNRKSAEHMSKMEKAARDLEGSFANLTASIVKGYVIGRAISAVFTSLTSSLAFATKEAINFEFQMDKIAAVTDGGEATLRSLEQTIRGVAIATNQSQNEIARTALEMGKLGLSSSQVEAALQGVANLARGLDEDLVTTGETVVAILNTYNFSAEESARVTDQLAFTVKASALDLQKFGTAFSYVGGTAAAAGVSFEELQGAMDVLSNAGIRSSTIGTQLRRIIADLSDENSKAAKAAGGTIESYGGLTNALDALGKKNIDIAGLTEIFGRTASSVAAIAIKYSAVIGDLAEQTRNATDLTQGMSNIINNNLKSSLDSITIAWANLGIEINKSNGFLKTFADGIAITLDAVKNRLEDGKLAEKFQQLQPKTTDAILKRNGLVDPITGLLPGQGFVRNSAIINAPEFAVFKAKIEEDLQAQKIRENLVAELAATFGKTKLPADFNPATDDIAPEDTLTWRWIRQLVGDDEVFDKAAHRAIQQFALKAEKFQEGDKFDVSIFDKPKKEKKELGILDPFEIHAQMDQLNKDGTTDRENVRAKRAKDSAKQEEEAAKSMIRFAKSIDMVSSKSEYHEWLETTRAEMELWSVAQQGINDSIEIFANFWANDMLTSAQNGFKGISDAFGDMAKDLTAQLIALTIRFTVFKILVSALGLSPASAPFFSFGANSAGGSGFLDAIIGGLGGKQFKAAANGFDGMVNSPKLFLAGENGPERVSIRPSTNAMGGSGGGATTIIVQGDVFGAEKLIDKVALSNERTKTRYV